MSDGTGFKNNATVDYYLQTTAQFLERMAKK
jgi:hypothetical protein